MKFINTNFWGEVPSQPWPSVLDFLLPGWGPVHLRGCHLPQLSSLLAHARSRPALHGVLGSKVPYPLILTCLKDLSLKISPISSSFNKGPSIVGPETSRIGLWLSSLVNWVGFEFVSSSTQPNAATPAIAEKFEFKLTTSVTLTSHSYFPS